MKSEHEYIVCTRRKAQEMACPFQALERSANDILALPKGESLSAYLHCQTPLNWQASPAIVFRANRRLPSSLNHGLCMITGMDHPSSRQYS